ncbi:ATP-binding protein [Streptomyces sp. NPDC048279]|uniref:ATP-binding protein n=1 Tax=Streptomyces sp. NPDC048279 TaxID=3154714 RepID=UPI00341555BC
MACLQREVSARESRGGAARVRTARFPAIKTIEELDVTHLRGMTRQQLAHLSTLDFVAGKENVVFLGPPGRHTRRSGSRSAPAGPATASRSPLSGPTPTLVVPHEDDWSRCETSLTALPG